jgi:hypothetical protein
VPTAQQDKQALDFITQNPSDARAPAIMQKLGVDSQDIAGWRYASEKPDDEKAIQVKNKIFNKIAIGRPTSEEGGADPWDRFAVKTFLDSEPRAQEAYFKKKGYDTRLSQKGEVEVKKPGDTQFKVIDPSGIDLWDATDIINDIGEAVVTGVSTGAKALGFVGAPATGGTSILAASGLGGLAGGGYEAANQAIGGLLDVRDEANPSKIAMKAALNAAIPGASAIAGKGLKATGSGIGRFWGSMIGKEKASAPLIREAAETIGAKATPGQLFDSQMIQKMESSLSQDTGKLGGWGLRNQIDKNWQAVGKTVRDLLGDRSQKTAYQSGQEAGGSLSAELSAKIKPAKEIYEKYESVFSRKAYQPSLDGITQTLDDLTEQFKYNDDVVKELNTIRGKLPSVNNLTDLKKLRSTIGDTLGQAMLAKKQETVRALGDVYSSVTGARSSTLLNLAESRGSEFFNIAKKEIEQADSIYKSAIDDVATLTGKNVKGGTTKALESFLEKNPEIKLIKKVLDTNDPAKISGVKQKFPQSFEILRRARVEEIFNKSAKNGVDLDPTVAAKQLSNMPPETATLLFGADSELKIKALQTFMNTRPTMVGKSGTPEGINLFNYFNLIHHAHNLGRATLQKIITNPQMGQDIFSKAGKFLDSGAGKGTSVFFGNMFAPKPSEDNFGLQTPQRSLRLPK